MLRFGEPKTRSGKYDAAQCLAVWREFPHFVQSSFWLSDRYTDEFYPGDIEGDLPAERQARENLLKLNYSHFKSICTEHALARLPSYFASLCNHVSRGFDENPRPTENEERHTGFNGATWYFQNVITSLLEAMENQSKEVSDKLAQTAVTLKVFDALNYAWEEKALVHIEGDSRFGKTESVRAWANMHPGRARLVTVPCTNSDSDLYKEVAESLGMEVNLSRTKLKDRVEYVLQNGRLGIIFDEAAFLIQQRYCSNTPPMRLNWIRTQIVDKGLPLALCATPQTYVHALARFVKKTGHNIQQFLGRTMLKVTLPDKRHKPFRNCDGSDHRHELWRYGLHQRSSCPVHQTHSANLDSSDFESVNLMFFTQGEPERHANAEPFVSLVSFRILSGEASASALYLRGMPQRPQSFIRNWFGEIAP